MTARERISKTIIEVMGKLPFYSELMLRAKILQFPERIKKAPNFCPTMAVSIDGNIYYDEAFVQSLTDKELMFVILHESLHKAYLHLHRCGNRNPIIWNIAADIFVDREVVQSLMYRNSIDAQIPKGRIVASEYGEIEIPALNLKLKNTHKKTVEQLYDELAKNENVQKIAANAQGNGGGTLGKKIDSHSYEIEDGTPLKELTPAQRQEFEERAKDEVIEAATKCKKRGTLPAGLERELDKILKTKLDWRQYVWRHVVNELPYDFSLSRPSRRYLTQGMYLPGTIKENLDVVAMIDLSGSVSTKEQAQVMGLMTKLANQFRNVDITILSHDHEVQAVTKINQANEQKIKDANYIGGGGTSHIPCFEWVQEHKRNAPLIIAFTDGFTEFPNKQDVHSPTLWVISHNGIEPKDVPFGTAIKIEDIQ